MKKKLFIDVDGVITNTIKRFCDIYNKKYATHPNFKPADWTKVESWNFTDECPLLKTVDEVEEIFESYEMYDNPEFLDGSVDALFDLSNTYDITIVTMGSAINLGNKFEVLKDKIPFVDFIGIDNFKHKDKRKVDMTGSIFIDDVSKNLQTSNALIKICFGEVKPWNEDWTGKRCFDWNQITTLLL